MSTENSTEEDVQVHLEIYPPDSNEAQVRTIAAGIQNFVHIGIDQGEEEGTAVVDLTLSLLDAEQALDLLGLATLALHNYLAGEGK